MRIVVAREVLSSGGLWPGLLTLACGLLLGFGCQPSPPRPERAGAGADAGAETALFVDVASRSGLDFVHWNGMSGELYYSEAVGAGGALFDYDNDGDLDVYLVQGAMLGSGKEPRDAVFPPPAGPISDRLFRNDLPAESAAAGEERQPRFVDVTAEAGIEALGYGMGVATGDFDNDGWIDFYVTNFGANQLWRNLGPDAEGRVRFADVTESSGAGETRWSTSAAVLDFDNDGWLDLYVVNYVDFRLASHKPCRSPSSRPDYCGPQNYRGEADLLLRNLGPGAGGAIRFADVSLSSGIAREPGNGLGVVSSDFDGDGHLDLYVANDLMRNFLWHNRGGGSFENVALESGSAVNSAGRAEASMGVVAGDFDGDGDEDLFMTHLRGETNTAYRNDGHGNFEDASSAMQLAVASRPFTAFGVVTLDLENDGDLDLAVANGDVFLIEERLLAGDPFPLGQPNQLFRNLREDSGSSTFEEVSPALAGPAFTAFEVGRGLAVGDIDNDGDDDLLLTSNSGPARLLLNRAADGASWIGLRLLDGNRDALGAKVTMRLGDGAGQMRRVRTDSSYCSARDPRLRFGLGLGQGLGVEGVSIEVEWLDGSVEVWPSDSSAAGLPVAHYHLLKKGEGHPLTPLTPRSLQGGKEPS